MLNVAVIFYSSHPPVHTLWGSCRKQGLQATNALEWPTYSCFAKNGLQFWLCSLRINKTISGSRFFGGLDPFPPQGLPGHHEWYYRAVWLGACLYNASNVKIVHYMYGLETRRSATPRSNMYGLETCQSATPHSHWKLRNFTHATLMTPLLRRWLKIRDWSYTQKYKTWNALEQYLWTTLVRHIPSFSILVTATVFMTVSLIQVTKCGSQCRETFTCLTIGLFSHWLILQTTSFTRN